MFNITQVIEGLKAGRAFERRFTPEEGEGYEVLSPILGNETHARSRVSGTNGLNDFGGTAEVSFQTILDRFEPDGWFYHQR